VSDLTCDCSPKARPEIKEADKLPMGRHGYRLFVYCHTCKQQGRLADTERDAIWYWENEERTVEE
jgi:hypothetical protein